MPHDQYWATLDPDTLAREALSRWKDWRRYFWESGIGEYADKGRRYHYGLNDLGDSASRVQVGGSEMQFARMVVNKIRPVLRRSLAMISSQAPTMLPIAANSDAAAREQAISAKGILEHTHREHDTEAIDLEVLEIALCMGEGARQTLWDATRGEEEAVDPDTQQPMAWSGDFVVDTLTPFDMARDPSWRSRRKWPWLITRTWENRWEWAARFPEDQEKRDRILAAKSLESENGEPYDFQFLSAQRITTGDAIPVYRFFHVDCLAIPGGRAFTFLGNGTWLEDGRNPYKGLPVSACASGMVIGTSLAYADVFSALGLSDALNAMRTAIMTNTTRWGPGVLLDTQGSGLQHSRLGNGASVLTVKDKDHLPVAMEVPPVSPDVFKHVDALSEEINEALGMNATAMGNPPFAGMPAQLAAILDQKAREYSDGLAKSYTTYKQACATQELQILKTFPENKRIVTIQGKSKAWMLKSFSREDLSSVSRVAMEPAPPGTGTVAFKWAMVDALSQKGVELPPKDLINLLRTGEYESPFEAEEANTLRIKAENEGLQQGKVPPVIMARTHWIDIPEHLSLLSSPDVTEQPEVVGAVLETVRQKLAQWRAMPVDLLQLLGGPLPPAPMMAPPGAPGEAPPQEEAPSAPQNVVPTQAMEGPV